ncbi:KilA-N domain-containing protein [Pseudomonas fulva]|uniref:KilA-N domain-containing protein n=1 Tax=Pseudomonas fulva TaxID=47880 RepID=UPI00191F44F9|nr:KilA-N domain-containing protein [Pseudomonas fulva]MBN4166877.1 KilA-N domain-containing protein [Pseudomonas fulva]
MTFKFREDGYFNMSHAAKQFGKHLYHFWDSPATIEYVASLKEAIFSTLNSNDLEMVDVVQGNRYVPGRGTWAHPKLAVFFARWLDTKFAVFCDMTIDDLVNGHSKMAVALRWPVRRLQAF